jgi:asparagine synthase (glutamine-hydrolysing)
VCGIAGLFNFRSFAPADARVVEQMTRILSYRGPDADGLFVSGPVGFGHRRLSILDLSEKGRQPMQLADGRYVITYNGEVYNYVELREALERDGRTFRTDTDTEVVLALYARDGASCLDHLNGMFAFAIWDRDERRLFVARDRIGIKPLYYVETRDGIAFASEAKSLFLVPGVPCEVAEPVLGTYMAFGYVPGEETLFRGIRKLLPGHYLTADAGGIGSKQYWDVDYAPHPTRTPQETADELRALLLDAMRIHLRSDVPVGVFLSGGLDSSATVALLTEGGVRNIKTFSVAYREGKGFDESPYARLVADRFQTTHKVLYLDAAKFQGFIPDYVWHMDEPVTEAAAISLYFIAKLLREDVVVALSGEGADELFAGYEIYRYMRWLEGYRKLPQWLRQAALDHVARAVPHPKARKYARLAGLPLDRRYIGVSLHDVEDARALFTDEARASLDTWAPHQILAAYYDRTEGRDPLTRMLYTDLKTWLVDDLLIKADKMTMANSVELRVPFLDYRVVEYAATIPSDMKIHRGKVKWVLKEAMKHRLPRQILERTKVGFPTPLALMFSQDLSGYLRDLLLSSRSRSRGYFKSDRVARLIDEHAAGRADHHELLWKLVVLEEWHRRFTDGAQAAAA